ncbi:MAG: substrate-binding domain-containing protein [Clostridia bacterium]|nr:substrate-binding domain-containing protein [Clostridia bacterium]
MDKKKLRYQIPILVGFALLYVALGVFIYLKFTVRVAYERSDGLKAKSIELDEYLPFDDNSQTVTIDTDLKLESDLPVIDGAAALYPVFSGFVGSTYPEASVVFDGTDFEANSALKMNNTRSAYQEVVDGTADIVFCAYPSDEQLQYAKDNGVELVFEPIGQEAFVFIVNENNPVDGLTSEQVRDIYSGKITDWSEVGGTPGPIVAISRNEGSGSQSTMIRFMNGQKIKDNHNLLLGKGIAFSFRFYVENITNYGGIKLLALDGVEPTKENIRNGTYPSTSYFYAVYRADNDNPNVPILIDWILSDEGQYVVEANGYVGIN